MGFGMARRSLCAENVPQIEHFEILRPVCAQYTCVTTRKMRVRLYTISLLQHTRNHAIYKQGTHTYAMSLIQNEEPNKAPPPPMFPHGPHGGAVYMTSGNISQYPMQQQQVFQTLPMPPMHAVSAIPTVESVFQKAPVVQPQAPPFCVPVQSVQMAQAGALPNAPCFFVQ